MGDKHTEEQVVFCQNSEFRGQLEMIISLSSVLFCDFSVASESKTPGTQISGWTYLVKEAA